MTTTYRPRFQWIDTPIEAIFIRRLNRFACLAQLPSGVAKVYLPNSGRLEELLRPGARVIVEKRRDGGKTQHDLLLVETVSYPSGRPLLAAVDSRLPPQLLRWVIEASLIPVFSDARIKSMEPTVAEGRLDLLLEEHDLDHFVETKSVNLIDQSGIARFPDAPTARGSRHLHELVRLKRAGFAASLVFIVVRQDAIAMAPFQERDPDFTQALRRAASAGVNLIALAFSAGPSMRFEGSLPIFLEPDPFPGFWPSLGDHS